MEVEIKIPAPEANLASTTRLKYCRFCKNCDVYKEVIVEMSPTREIPEKGHKIFCIPRTENCNCTNCEITRKNQETQRITIGMTRFENVQFMNLTDPFAHKTDFSEEFLAELKQPGNEDAKLIRKFLAQFNSQIINEFSKIFKSCESDTDLAKIKSQEYLQNGKWFVLNKS